jgi:RNA polymerase subunit RPABC4/transcription elongation factor Spt4
MSKTCGNCDRLLYDSVSDCYICGSTEDRVELDDEPCDDWIEEAA